ncbi:hypothetical protein FB451DRAFT_1178284 [Mycena latifolia]|nr:hypothetical protein FB451DRAFT_1178284 [Mycena latifolia]
MDLMSGTDWTHHIPAATQMVNQVTHGQRARDAARVARLEQLKRARDREQSAPESEGTSSAPFPLRPGRGPVEEGMSTEEGSSDEPTASDQKAGFTAYRTALSELSEEATNGSNDSQPASTDTAEATYESHLDAKNAVKHPLNPVGTTLAKNSEVETFLGAAELATGRSALTRTPDLSELAPAGSRRWTIEEHMARREYTLRWARDHAADPFLDALRLVNGPLADRLDELLMREHEWRGLADDIPPALVPSELHRATTPPRPDQSPTSLDFTLTPNEVTPSTHNSMLGIDDAPSTTDGVLGDHATTNAKRKTQHDMGASTPDQPESKRFLVRLGLLEGTRHLEDYVGQHNVDWPAIYQAYHVPGRLVPPGTPPHSDSRTETTAWERDHHPLLYPAEEEKLRILQLALAPANGRLFFPTSMKPFAFNFETGLLDLDDRFDDNLWDILEDSGRKDAVTGGHDNQMQDQDVDQEDRDSTTSWATFDEGFWGAPQHEDRSVEISPGQSDASNDGAPFPIAKSTC